MNLVVGECLKVVTRVDTSDFNVRYDFVVFRGANGDCPVATVNLSSADMIGVDWVPASARTPVEIVSVRSQQ